MGIVAGSDPTYRKDTLILPFQKAGRLLLPADHREFLGNPFVLVKAPEGLLLAFRSEHWHSVVSPRGYPYALYQQQEVWEPVEVETCRGRFAIPLEYLDYADLSRSRPVAVISVGNALGLTTALRLEEEQERRSLLAIR